MKVCDDCKDCCDDDFDFCAVCGAGLRHAFSGSRVLAGRYRLEKKLAEGAMGMVFEAVHLAVGSRVAVKVMQPQQKDLGVAVQRFHKEARILGAVKHPHAVLITDFDVDDGPDRLGAPVAFLVTELLRGRSLADLLDERLALKDQSGGGLSLDEVERVVGPLCEALEEAHAQGIIHRDLKPSNVFLEKLRDGSEVVKVLDFGIAKLLSRTPSSSAGPRGDVPVPIDFSEPTMNDRPPAGTTELRDEILSALDDDDDDVPAVTTGRGGSTYSGLMVGTVPYMAPEQMTGDRVTRRADVHALAVMVFEMLAGRLPFDGDDDDIIEQKLADERPSLRELGVVLPAEDGGALDALLSQCFALDPEARPESVRVIAAAVAKAASARRGVSTEDPIAALSMRLSTTARALIALEDLEDTDQFSPASPDLAARDRCRDTLLACCSSLEKARRYLDAAKRKLSAPPQAQLVGAHLELDDAVAAVRDPLTRIANEDVDGGSYLLLLWRRIDLFAQTISDLLEGEQLDSAHDLLSAVLDPTPQHQRTPVSLSTLADRLIGKDSIEAGDALIELLEERASEVVRALSLAVDDDTATRLRLGLWRHADELLLRDVGAERQALRFVPFLAGQPADQGRFAAVVAALRDRRGAVVVAEVQESLADPRPALRCLLLHPVDETRVAAAGALGVIDLWTAIAHPRTPLLVLRFLFARLQEHGQNDHLRVFFFCVKETVAAAGLGELKDALALVRAFFDVSGFHEDVLFEPLLELERGLRARADVAGVLDDSYLRAVAAFVDVGAREETPLEHLKDVPLPIQRKLAREGRFLTTFVCHHNERVAAETLPHLLRLDDVTRFLRLVTIHRVVLVDLAKRRRFFKKDAPKLALLANPKTPAAIARPFVGLVPAEQLRTLSTSRQINPDVRRLIVQALSA
ncbi:MAG: serine/threonine-protein kinase [Deltaproteobacteria bacterium]|nr:serine/threonine-protein kinase [Deltaproteobacteria bacterium]